MSRFANVCCEFRVRRVCTLCECSRSSAVTLVALLRGPRRLLGFQLSSLLLNHLTLPSILNPSRGGSYRSMIFSLRLPRTVGCLTIWMFRWPSGCGKLGTSTVFRLPSRHTQYNCASEVGLGQPSCRLVHRLISSFRRTPRPRDVRCILRHVGGRPPSPHHTTPNSPQNTPNPCPCNHLHPHPHPPKLPLPLAPMQHSNHAEPPRGAPPRPPTKKSQDRPRSC
jgi:hypothetical protein